MVCVVLDLVVVVGDVGGRGAMASSIVGRTMTMSMIQFGPCDEEGTIHGGRSVIRRRRIAGIIAIVAFVVVVVVVVIGRR